MADLIVTGKGLKAQGKVEGTSIKSTGTVDVPQPATTAATFALDNSGGLGLVGSVVPNNGSFQVGPAAGFTGLMIIQDTATDADWAIVYASGASVKIVAQAGALFSVVLTTAAKINVNYSATALLIENKTGVARTLSVMSFRTRASN